MLRVVRNCTGFAATPIGYFALPSARTELCLLLAHETSPLMFGRSPLARSCFHCRSTIRVCLALSLARRDNGWRPQVMMGLSNCGTYFRWLASGAAFCWCLLVLSTAIAQPEIEAEATSLGRQGVDLLEARQFEPALKKLKAALAIWKKIDHPAGQAAILGKIGEAYWALQRGDESVSSHLTAGDIWKSLREYRAALRQYSMALKIQDEIVDVVRYGRTRNAIGEVHMALGNYGWALEHFRTAVLAYRSMWMWLWDEAGEARTLANLGEVYTRLGRYEEAREKLQAALAIPLADLTAEEGSDLRKALTKKRDWGKLDACQGLFEKRAHKGATRERPDEI